ncbi:hypothetical protein, partial [Staphylococcus aureus]
RVVEEREVEKKKGHGREEGSKDEETEEKSEGIWNRVDEISLKRHRETVVERKGWEECSGYKGLDGGLCGMKQV